jgi:hypothetical protein
MGSIPELRQRVATSAWPLLHSSTASGTIVTINVQWALNQFIELQASAHHNWPSLPGK